MRAPRIGPAVLALAATVALLLAAVPVVRRVIAYQQPRAALEAFFRFDARAEEQLCDPLVLCGDAVVPLVVQALDDPSSPGRPWLAAFLGLRADASPEVVGILARLVADPEEHEHTRRYALQALERVRRADALQLATTFEHTKELGHTARDVLRGDRTLAYSRSWWEAAVRWKR